MDNTEALNKVMEDLRREEAGKNAMQAVDDAHMRSILSPACRTPAQVFFTTLALNLNPAVKWDTETAATDGDALLFNPDWIATLTPDETHGVVCGHEPLHNGFEHFARGQHFEDAQIANIAADAEINQVCLDAGFVLPDSAVVPGRGKYKDLPVGKCFEEYYSILYEKKQNGELDGLGDGDDPGGCGSFLPTPDPAASAAQAGKWQRQMAAAAQAAEKAQGDMPGSLQDMIDRILKPRVDPWQVLRDYMTRLAKNEQSWAKLNRRHLARGIYLPGRHGYELGDVVLLADISGSMDERQCQLTAGFLQGILELYPGRLTIIYHDTKVLDVVDWTIDDGELEIPVRSGGGGTCHIDAVAEIDRRCLEPSIILACTDMYTTWPADPGVPFVWLDTEGTTIEPPFGKKIVIAETA